MEEDDEDICRVCRSNASPDNPLFHPCICTGSIRHVHQDCLVQWLRHSRKEYCELCKHKYTFKPIYSPDMPSRLPLKDLFVGLAFSIGSAVKCWIHYTLVAVAWLGIVPLTASRIYSCVFAGSVNVLVSLPKAMLSTKNIGSDILHGCVVVACTLIAFICLVWLRIQILNGDMPAWLNPRPGEPAQQANPQQDNEAENGAEVLDDVDDNNNANDVAEQNVALPQANDAAGDNINWNAIDWERGGDEPTWERMLGLDGSLMFLEHVFWVIALNTLFILVFAFCPYHLGHFFIISVDLNSYIVATRFEGVLTTLCGYVLITSGFLVCHVALQVAKFHWPGWIFGLCYVILKVGLLVLVEIGLFPLLCGTWIDICTLQMFNSTLQSRKETYLNTPGTSIFSHWVVGMIFVFYYATFLMILREVLRPGTLWFIRNLNDPDFNPINEMIHLPIYRHCRRFLLSIIMFGSTIIVIAWLPVRFLLVAAPNLLPYKGTSDNTAGLSEFPLQLLVLQFILPSLLEQGYIKVWLKAVIKWWAHIIGTLLGIRSYLLGDSAERFLINGNRPENNNAEPVQIGNQVPPPLIQGNGFVDYEENQPYVRPKYFSFRIILLLLCMSGTLAIISSAVLSIPVYIGRGIINGILNNNGFIFNSDEKDSVLVINELYTFAVGLYCCMSFGKICSLVSVQTFYGWNAIKQKILECFIVIGKACVIGFFIVGLIPGILGVLFDLVVIIPARVPLHQTPVILLWQDWALGILLLKLSIAALLLGPTTWLKDDITQAYQLGIRRLQLFKLILHTIIPVILGLLTCLAVPYFIGHLIPNVFQCSQETKYFFHWRTYPILIVGMLFAHFCWYEIGQFRRLCDHIKNERYLIGKRLQDYEPSTSKTTT